MNTFILYADTAICALLLNEYALMKYPLLHAEFWSNVMYYSVHIFSTGEQLFNKHIHPHFIYDDLIVNNLEVILDDGTNCISDTEDKDIPNQYKFAIYAQLNDGNVRKKRIYKTLPEDKVYDCDETSYRFVLIEIKYGDTCIKLDFNVAKSTYYVVNNEFDSTVVRYLMKSVYKIDVPEQYTISILDHNVNKVEFDNTSVLKFNKDDYEIIHRKENSA